MDNYSYDEQGYYKDNNYDTETTSNHMDKYLLSGEQLLWQGTQGKASISNISPVHLLFSIFWLGFSIVWCIFAGSAGGFFWLFGIPFVIIGVIQFKTAVFGKNQDGKVIYAITNQRVMKLIERKQILDATLITAIDSISIYNKGKDKGDLIIFKKSSALYENSMINNNQGFSNFNMSNNNSQMVFINIDDLNNAYRIMNEQLIYFQNNFKN